MDVWLMKEMYNQIVLIRKKGQYKNVLQYALFLVNHAQKKDSIDWDFIIKCYFEIFQAYFSLGDRENAHIVINDIQTLCQEHGNDWHRMYMFKCLFNLYEVNDEREESKKYLLMATDIAIEQKDYEFAALCYSNICYLLIFEKKFEKAFLYAKMIKYFLEKVEVVSELIKINCHLIYAEILVGLKRFDEAEHHLHILQNWEQLDGFPKQKGQIFAVLGEKAYLQGNLDLSISFYSQASEVLDMYGDYYFKKICLNNIIDNLFASNRDNEAEMWIEQRNIIQVKLDNEEMKKIVHDITFRQQLADIEQNPPVDAETGLLTRDFFIEKTNKRLVMAAEQKKLFACFACNVILEPEELLHFAPLLAIVLWECYQERRAAIARMKDSNFYVFIEIESIDQLEQEAVNLLTLFGNLLQEQQIEGVVKIGVAHNGFGELTDSQIMISDVDSCLYYMKSNDQAYMIYNYIEQ